MSCLKHDHGTEQYKAVLGSWISKQMCLACISHLPTAECEVPAARPRDPNY